MICNDDRTGWMTSIYRNPKDAAISLYHYFKNWLFDGAALSLGTFMEWIVLKDTQSVGEQSVIVSQLEHLGITLQERFVTLCCV